MNDSHRTSRRLACVIALWSVLLLTSCARTPLTAQQPPHPFAIKVIDDQTGRGVPLVELKTVASVRYYTDSAGIAVIDDQALEGLEAFFYVSSDGYEYPADGFGFRGVKMRVVRGKVETIKLKRLNIAERLYRVTGEGIYRDSLLAGQPVPIRHPLLNAQVSGQDSVQDAIYHGKIFWMFGDTARPLYPLGQFGASAGTSPLPGRGGLDPSVGIDIDYYAGPDGFSRPMVPGQKAAAWMDGLMVLPDNQGHERLIAHLALMQSLEKCVGRSIAVLDDETNTFQTLRELPIDSLLRPAGHPFRHRVNGKEYFYFGQPFPCLRVIADWKSVQSPEEYEAFTCLKAGAKFDGAQTALDRDAGGKLIWSWKKNTEPVNEDRIQKLITAGKMREDERWLNPHDVQTHKPVRLSVDSVAWNPYRNRWIGITGQLMGDTSLLGEIWYTEADQPEGPWRWARKIVTHDDYSFYNPHQHVFFNQDNGRVIYFQGTYSSMFTSGKRPPTPRYDYNQIMYRLDLADPRLSLPAE